MSCVSILVTEREGGALDSGRLILLNGIALDWYHLPPDLINTTLAGKFEPTWLS